ncbi:MAG: hypothetical protein HOY71_03605 [Nonomuraea sp.]|nr:hypothetical protein [Nonomuraea sp.]
MRLFLACAAALTLCATAQPASATSVAWGYAWSDGATGLRFTPRLATYHKPVHTLKTIKGAKELRLDYSAAAYRRITVACDLKETEGSVAIDAQGLGKTRCKPSDLTASLQRGYVPVRVEYSGTKATKVTEFVPGVVPAIVADGTIKRIDDRTIAFTRKGKTIRLRYSFDASFLRVTAGCGDGWLTGKPVNADRNGLGRKGCSAADLTKVLRGVRYPVLARLDYEPMSGAVREVTEWFRDA